MSNFLLCRDVIRDGGSTVDGAIATLLCNGVYSPQSMGIGGGFFMVVYTRGEGLVETLISRETAPHYAHKDMFEDDHSMSSRGWLIYCIIHIRFLPLTSLEKGPLAVAIPGEIKGYAAAKERYGNPEISWQRLVQPSVDMCRNGVEVSESLAGSLQGNSLAISRDPGLRLCTRGDPSSHIIMPYLCNLLMESILHTSYESYGSCLSTEVW